MYWAANMKKFLFLTTCCFCFEHIAVSTVHAQASAAHTPSDKKKDSRRQKKDAAKPRNRDEAIDVTERRKVSGTGMMVRHTVAQTVSSLSHSYIEMQSPTSTIESLIATLPGVVSTSEGPLTTSFSTIHIRGMGQAEIGMTFEGMPAANPFTYSTYTPSLVDSQNMGQVNVMQGSVDINSPTYNATGAEISATIRGPADHHHVYVAGSGGSYGTNKDFIRYDTGEIGHTGAYAFASGSYSRGDMWRGVGDIERWHVDSALTKKWARGSESKVIFGWTKASQGEWLYPSLANWKTYGMKYGLSDQYSPGATHYVGLNGKNTGAVYGTLKNHFSFGNGLSLDAQAYSVEFHGPYYYGATVPVKNGFVGAESYSSLDDYKNLPGYSSSSKTLTTAEVSNWYTLSSGLLLTGHWKHKFNTLSLTYWYSYAQEAAQMRFYPVNGSGQWSGNALTANGGIPVSEDNENGLQQLNSFAVDDKMSFLNGRLTLDGGIRMAMVNRQYTQDLPKLVGANYKTVKNVFVPAPQVLINYNFNPHHQIYVNGTTGYHLPASLSSQLASYSRTTGKAESAPLIDYKPEYMITEELGYRYSGLLMANVAGFHYNVTNHQVSAESYVAGSTSTITQLINAGGMEAFGVQAEIATHPWHHVSAYASGQYLRTKNGNNLAYSGDYLRTKGKEEVGAPRYSGSLGLTYNDGTWFGNFTLTYTGSQYATLMNDQRLPGYITANLGVGRNLPKIGHVTPKIKLNLVNMGDEHYLSSTYGYTAAATTQKGILGTTIKGSAPTYVIGSPFVAMGTISADF
ncbi:TonB-dependent receptor [Acetobacter cibinongensis]|uniref:TonB-dependent receptor n=2 Tax=Acetobacter cibinongensis TaxID=146475 RepID=A0A0D6N0Y1_9PROT|nr:TonB-dependent receptor [Acetobacter cibinongensis]GEL59117.1 TonB-dependent receptor [Acetobacter cibinongensis]